jgi:hypothetical protein
MAIELEDTLHADGSLEMASDKLRVGAALQAAIATPAIAVAEEGTLVGTRPTLNFVGAAVTAVDNAAANRVDVTLITPPPAVADAATGFAWTANAASLDVGAGHNFAATNTLTGNSTLTLTNGTDGCQGMIFVKQDATGGRTLAFTIAGRTVRRDLNVLDANPLTAPNGETMYQYFYVTLAGVACVVLNKVYVQ